MLPLEPPTSEILVSVIAGLVNGELLREEVVAWQRAVITEFDYLGPGVYTVPLSIGEGYWEFVSLSALTCKSHILSDPHQFCIRDEDLTEYLHSIAREDLDETTGALRFCRWYQPYPEKKSDTGFPIATMLDQNIMRRYPLRSTRGIFDSLHILQETSTFVFEGSWFSCCLHHEVDVGQVTIFGSASESKRKISRLLDELQVAPGAVDWTHPELEA